MNLKTLNWDDYLLKEFSINKKCLPIILNSSDNFGSVTNGLLKGIPITGVIGDQQSACLGHLLEQGEIKNTYGTGSFILMHTGNNIIKSNYGLLTTVLYKAKGDPVYALEGAIETAGSVLEWLKNNMRLYNSFEELKPMFDSVSGSQGVTFVPAFSGLFSPYWNDSARGLLIGLTSHTQPGNIIHAAYEAISLRTLEVINSLIQESGIKASKMKVDGGMTVSSDFLQIQSNIIEMQVIKTQFKEVTILGCAIAAGLHDDIQIWKDYDEIRKLLLVDKYYQPNWESDKREEILSRWKKAITRSIDWV